MAQTGFTPISLYYTTTAAAVPTAGNLVAGELAINTQDGKLFYKDAAGVVQVIAGKGGAGVAGGSNTQVQYNSSGSLAGSSNFVFDGTNVGIGTSSPNRKLTIEKTGAVGFGVPYAQIGYSSFTAGGYYTVGYGFTDATYTNPPTEIGAISTSSSGGTTADIVFATRSVTTNTAPTERMRITALGQVQTTLDASISGLTVGKGAGAVSTNTAVGATALSGSNSGTGENVGIGYEALKVNTTGSRNTAVGLYSAGANTTGANNVAIGNSAFQGNTTGGSNVAVGNQALQANTTASNNTAVGYQAGYSNTTGTQNVFIGNDAGYSNTARNQHTIVGFQAGYYNVNGNINTFVGWQAGFNSNPTTPNTNSLNCFIGYYAGYGVTTGAQNTFIGGNASGYLVTTGNKNTIVGNYDGNSGGLDIRTASNYIVLSDGDGNPRIWVTNSNVVYAPGIYANTSANSANVVAYGSGGDLYRSTSALKYKQDVRDLPSIDINSFRPVVYKSKCASDDQTIDHFGFIADEVDQAGIKELVSYDDNGEIENFKYDRMTAVLVKAIQELKAEFDAYKSTHP